MIGARRFYFRHRAVGIDVTGAGAIAQFAHGVADIAVFGMRFGIVIVCVASRAIGFVGRRRPRHGFAVGLVAACAGYGRIMRTREIGRDVGVNHRRPGGRVVTIVTIAICGEMISWFSRGNRAVVAAGARTGRL